MDEWTGGHLRPWAGGPCPLDMGDSMIVDGGEEMANATMVPGEGESLTPLPGEGEGEGGGESADHAGDELLSLRHAWYDAPDEQSQRGIH